MKRFLFFSVALIYLFACDQVSEIKPEYNVFTDSTAFDMLRPLTTDEIEHYRSGIESYYRKNLLNTGFNGGILIAKNGTILFEDYHGTYNFSTGEPINPHSAFHLASISKTFTAGAVLKLLQQGRLKLEDSMQQYFPGFPYPGVTIKTLLNHRSGLPNYLYFMDSLWDKTKKATNEDVLNLMTTHKPPVTAKADSRYQYCNTNYVMLALIVEHITKQSFPQYMKDSVFIPLGLADTYVFSMKDTLQYNPTYSVTKPFPMDHLDCTYGDKNIYSTPRDLLQWDKILYQQQWLNKQTLDLAYTPFSNETRSKHNYGLGWHLYFTNEDTIIYHNGLWHGSNTVFTRLVQDTATIIVLGNKVNRNIYRSREISGIFNGRMDTTELEE